MGTLRIMNSKYIEKRLKTVVNKSYKK